MNSKKKSIRQVFKSIGPGLLFASAAIGTSHLVLSTRAGAYHGMVFFWIIIAALIVKYPFYQYGARYASATNFTLIKGYRDQGKSVVVLFLVIIFVNMFAVTGAIAAVCAGLLSTMFGVNMVSIPMLAGLILVATVLLLLLGGYKGLDQLVKLISVVLLVCILIAFAAVLSTGPSPMIQGFEAPSLWEGAGLTLLISLLGWMPAGMEASTMNSIWTIEKMKTEKYQPTVAESLFDFNLGYIFTSALALIFMTIGSYTVFGTGEVLDGNATQFSNKLLSIFTAGMGSWVYPFLAIAAFGTIFGTLVTVLDAFPRCFVRGIRALKYNIDEYDATQELFLKRAYRFCLIGVGLGGFLLFYFSAASMIKVLELATILSFLTAPILAYLNLRAIQSPEVKTEFRPKGVLLGMSYVGLILMVGFALYYLSTFI